MKIKLTGTLCIFFGAFLALLFWWPATGLTHCDTVDGPVVTAAQKALETENVTPVLMWVQEKNEVEVKAAFEHALAVRKLGPKAKELADMYFFETLVRIHRAGEGAPYTGVKPAGSVVEPAVVEADKALETGSVEHLEKHLVEAAAKGIRDRFTAALEAKKHAGESVSAGRKFVASYVTFVHYVERLHTDIAAKASEHGAAEQHEAHGQHHHQ
mgnify:CR=1 FL=1